MIGIVVVSHSRALAHAAVDLACEMVPPESRPAVAVAAGLDEDTFGTDAAAVGEAIGQVDSPDGVLVLLDLGSAVLSAEMALEFLDPDVAARVRLTPAPLVEGLVAAMVTAGTGAGLDAVDKEALAGLSGKEHHLRLSDEEQPPGAAAGDPAAGADEGAEFRHTLTNPHGLHARPAAALVSALAGLDAEVQLRNATRGSGPASASSVMQVSTLDLRRGDELHARVTGPDAQVALERLKDLAARSFGDDAGGSPDEPASAATLPAPVTGPVVRLPEPEVGGYRPGRSDVELDRFETARKRVDDYLSTLSRHPRPALRSLAPGIFDAQRALLSDRSLVKAVRRDVEEGRSAIESVAARCDELAERFEALSDPYLQERAQDLRSLSRLLCQALRHRRLAVHPPHSPHVLAGRELDAATAAELDPAHTLVVVTSAPGTSGHGAILAAAAGIPLVAGVPEAEQWAAGSVVAVDPDGTVTA